MKFLLFSVVATGPASLLCASASTFHTLKTSSLDDCLLIATNYLKTSESDPRSKMRYQFLKRQCYEREPDDSTEVDPGAFGIRVSEK